MNILKSAGIGLAVLTLASCSATISDNAAHVTLLPESVPDLDICQRKGLVETTAIWSRFYGENGERDAGFEANEKLRNEAYLEWGADTVVVISSDTYIDKKDRSTFLIKGMAYTCIKGATS